MVAIFWAFTVLYVALGVALIVTRGAACLLLFGHIPLFGYGMLGVVLGGWLVLALATRDRKTPATEKAATPASEQGSLREANARLKRLRADCAAGNHSGHPEEMLEDIEFAEKAVKRIQAEKGRNG